MTRIKYIIGTVILFFLMVGIVLSVPGESNSQTRVCPNSSIKCNVTVNHPEHGKITVESEKGPNDDSVILPEIE